MVQDRKLDSEMREGIWAQLWGSQKPGIVLKPKDGKEPLHT